MHKKVSAWLSAVRLPLLGASILPAVLGSVIACKAAGMFDWFMMLMVVAGVALFHTGSNLINEYFDYRSGADAANEEYAAPFTGGTRVLVEGRLKPNAVLAAAVFSYLSGSMIGIWLAYTAGFWIYVLGIIGILSGVLYVAPGVSLLNAGWGEITVGMNFGILIVEGAFYVQTGYFSVEAFFVSLPISLLIAAVLLINEFEDYKGDKSSGKISMVVRIGRKGSVKCLAVVFALAAVSIILLPIVSSAPASSLLALLTVPFLWLGIRLASLYYDDPVRLVPANAAVILSHSYINVFLIVAYMSGLTPTSIWFSILVCTVVTEIIFIKRLCRIPGAC